jgi:hypothetical protein
MSTLRSNFTRSCLTAVVLCAALFSALAPSPAAAELLCRCAYPSLSAVICNNDLTAKIKVRETFRGKDANYFLAEVRTVFRGVEEAGSWIVISAPRSCGFELKNGKSYAVSLNVDTTTGYYTTFACGSFVSEWNKLSAEDHATLEAPSCSPCDPACEDGQTCIMQEVVCVTAPCNPIPACVPSVASEGEVCYRFSEMDPAMSVDRTCAEGLKCVSTSDTFGFNSVRSCQQQNWCLNDSTAANDCDGLIHPMVVGQWGCTAENKCAWRAQLPN